MTGSSDQTRRPKLTIAHHMILVACVAMGAALSRTLNLGWRPDSTRWLRSDVEIIYRYGHYLFQPAPLCALLTLACTIVWLRQPGPVRETLGRRPGYWACAASSSVLAVGAGLNAAIGYWRGLWEPRHWTFSVLMPMGLVIVAVWCVGYASRVLHAPRGWLDWACCVLCLYWVLLAPLIHLAWFLWWF